MPSAPSMTRWSYDSDSGSMNRGANSPASLFHTGSIRAREMPRPLPVPPYQEARSGAIGRIDGRVTFPPGVDPSDFVVWLDGVRAGKPLPLARRYEIDHERGAFAPQVQGALVGGALLVRSLDATHFRVTFTSEGSDSVLAVVQETGVGQVVPTARPLVLEGMVLAASDERPPAQAWIRVFDQPYFAQPDSAGRFTIDSVPAGVWRMRAWHPRLGEREARVGVDSSGLSFADVVY